MAGSAQVRNGGSGGMMSTVELELPYSQVSRTKLLGRGRDVTFVKHCESKYSCTVIQ